MVSVLMAVLGFGSVIACCHGASRAESATEAAARADTLELCRSL
jgi:hypothetical protein